MAKRAKVDIQQFSQLPPRSEIKKACLHYILDNKSYLSRDVEKSAASYLRLNPEQLLLRMKGKKHGLFQIHIHWVMGEFTSQKIHTGPNGKKHKGPNEPYHVTEHGLKVA